MDSRLKNSGMLTFSAAITAAAGTLTAAGGTIRTANAFNAFFLLPQDKKDHTAQNQSKHR